MSVVAIVPAHNEQDRIGATVTALRAVASVDDVLVVDDASTDDTAARARAAGASVLRLARNAGKGGALRAGVAATNADVLVFIDADVGATASVAAVLLAPVLAAEADMTIARPPADRPSGFGLVERFARWGIERFGRATMARPLSGQRALRRAVLDRVRIADRFGVEVALTVDALRAGFCVTEVEYAIEHAKTGRDVAGFVHRARQGFDVARVLAARAFRRR